MKPLVSIIVLAYNADLYLRECLDSILAQTYVNLEVILVDDGSTDKTSDILIDYDQKNGHIRIFNNEQNRGISYSRNLGLGKAKGKYIAWLDSDDVAMPERIATQVAFLEDNPDYGLISSDLIIIDENSVETGCRTYPHQDNEIRKALTRYNPFAQPASMLRTDVLTQVGNYDESLECCEDYDLFLRVAAISKVGNIDKPLVKYRISGTQSKSRKLKLTILNSIQIQGKAVRKGFPDSAFNKAYRIGLRMLMLCPDRLILWFFIKVYYKGSN